MEMTDYRSLCHKRTILKGQLMRIKVFFEAHVEVTLQEAQVRLTMAEQLFKTFDEIQTLIENKKNRDGTQDADFIAECEGERILFEELYFAIGAMAHQIIQRNGQRAILDPEVVAVEATLKRIDTKKKQPVLKIPDFDGSCDKWILFKDAFESTIHNNPNLTDIQKFQYLRSALTGEAVEIIPMTVENYQRAWDLLKQNYENKKLIHIHLSQLLDLPAITRNNPVSLRQFIVHIRKNLKALEAFRISPEQLGDIILIHLAKRKLDFMTQRDWEQEQELDQDTERIPKIEELLEFLSHKCRTLEMMEYDKSKPESSKTTDDKGNEKRVALSVTTQGACRNCSEKHPLYRCEEFAKLSTTDKMKEVKTGQPSINYLKPKHYVKKCSKRSNFNTEQKLLNLSNKAALSPISTLFMDDIVKHINSSDEKLQLLAIQTCRNLPINDMIESGIVPCFINLLDSDHNIRLQFEAVWILGNIASGTFEQTQNVVKYGAIPKLVKLLKSASPTIVEETVWALGNIAGNGPYARDLVLGHNALPLLIDLIKLQYDTSIILIRNIVWTLSNLCRDPPPSFELISPILPVFNLLLSCTDSDVLADTCWTLSYLTRGSNDKIQAVLETGIIPKLVKLLTSEKKILIPALCTVGNIVTGDDAQTDAVISAGGLSYLGALLRNHRVNVVKEAAWAISNIMAGNTDQIQSVINAGLLPLLIELLQFRDNSVQEEAAWAITNLTIKGTIQHLTQLVEAGVLRPYCNLLAVKDCNIIIVVLSGLTNILHTAEKMGQVEKFVIMIKEAGGLDKIKALQHHQNKKEIYKKSMAIIDFFAFFSQSDVEEKALASKVRKKIE